MEIGVQSQGIIIPEDPEKGFELLRDSGFDCIDFSLNEYLTSKDLYKGKRNDFFDRSVEELKEYFTPLKETAGKFGIRIHQMHMPYPSFIPDHDDLNEYLKNEVAPKSIEICAFLDCKYIVMHGINLWKWMEDEEEEWKYTESVIESLAPVIKRSDVTLCIENTYSYLGNHIFEGACSDAKKAAERIDRINDRYGSEILGFCFDTGHANLIGLDFEKFLKILGKRIKILHIHDNDGNSDLHQIPFVFTRTRENQPSTDWDGFIRGLRAIGYNGVLNFETAPVLKSFPKEMKKDVLSFIMKIGQYLAGQIER